MPAIENLLGLCGERCEVRHFERQQHVQLLNQPVPVTALKLGDAVVAFSRREVGEVHQIAGRAGRYGMHEEGFVSVLAEAEPTARR